jgi:hypothetical protein
MRVFGGDQIAGTRAMVDFNGVTRTLLVTAGYTAFGDRLNATRTSLTRNRLSWERGCQSDALAGAATALDAHAIGLLHGTSPEGPSRLP